MIFTGEELDKPFHADNYNTPFICITDQNDVLKFNYEGKKLLITTHDGAFENTHYYFSETLTLEATLDY
jgi:hypothetical protein